jgi:vacuolar protein sorting-associated protein 26
VEIRLTPPDPSAAGTADGQVPLIVPMDHTPSWRLHKNPFWRVKHPAGGNKFTAAYPQQSQKQQQQSQQAPQQYQSPQPHQPFPSSEYRSENENLMNSSGTSGGSGVLHAYEASQDVTGNVILRLPHAGKKFEHLGIKVQFIGRIDMSVGIHEGRPHYDFISLSKELSPPGMLYQTETVLPFRFKNMDKEFESYRGRNVSVRYIVKVLMERKFLPPLTKEHDVWVQILGQAPLGNEGIKMEVGIEDCLHIEFEYDRRVHHLQDTIRGKIHFLLVRIKIKHMELAVIRRETSGEGVAIAAANAEGSTNATTVDASNIYTETQTLVKYEIMDGAPVKGEVIPVKLCLKGLPADLTPTYTAANNRFSVRYFLNLVLVDEDDRRYFKQQEIILWRKELG